MSALGWLANSLLLWGQWRLGRKERPGFLLVLLGEALWCVKAGATGQWDMLAICLAFGALAAWNWRSWRPPRAWEPAGWE